MSSEIAKLDLSDVGPGKSYPDQKTAIARQLGSLFMTVMGWKQSQTDWHVENNLIQDWKPDTLVKIEGPEESRDIDQEYIGDTARIMWNLRKLKCPNKAIQQCKDMALAAEVHINTALIVGEIESANKEVVDFETGQTERPELHAYMPNIRILVGDGARIKIA